MSSKMFKLPTRVCFCFFLPRKDHHDDILCAVGNDCLFLLLDNMSKVRTTDNPSFLRPLPIYLRMATTFCKSLSFTRLPPCLRKHVSRLGREVQGPAT
jgi:hypothetical protein